MRRQVKTQSEQIPHIYSRVPLIYIFVSTPAKIQAFFRSAKKITLFSNILLNIRNLFAFTDFYGVKRGGKADICC